MTLLEYIEHRFEQGRRPTSTESTYPMLEYLKRNINVLQKKHTGQAIYNVIRDNCKPPRHKAMKEIIYAYRRYCRSVGIEPEVIRMKYLPYRSMKPEEE